MELEKEYLCLEQTECVFKKAINCEEEYQESLPQYCDDIKKIIKCTSKCVITSTSITNGEVKIYGKSYIYITYESEGNCLSYADFEEDFCKSLNIDNLSESAFIKTNICTKYTNFRVINQRRIDVHSSFNISVRLYDKVTSPCIKSCNESKLKVNKIKCSNVISNCITKCEFDEEIEIPADSKPIKRIIGYSGFVTLNETKTIKDKALVKANIDLNILYTQDNDEETITKCVHNFDISKIVDISGLLDTDEVITKLNLGNVFLKCKNNAEGCLNNIEIIGEVCIDLSVIRQKELSYINDGYIVNKKSNCNYEDFKSNKNSRKICDKVQKEFDIKLNSNIENIVDVGLNINNVSLKSNQCIVELVSNVLFSNENNELCNFECSQDLVLFNDEFDDGIADVHLCSFDYSIKDSECLKIRVTLCYNAILYTVVIDKVLSEIECTDESLNYPALTVYFAKQNELVWDIAKKFSSDENLIIKENELKGKLLSSNKVLIVPGI